MNDIIKTIFKMIITAVLAVLFVEIFITLLIVSQVISVDMWQNTPFLHFMFSLTKEPNFYNLTFHPAFEATIAFIFGSIPLITFLTNQKSLNN